MTAPLLAGIALLGAIAELATLLGLRTRLAPRLTPRAIGLMLAPGLALMLAVLLATLDAGPAMLGATLFVALLLHLADLRSRR